LFFIKERYFYVCVGFVQHLTNAFVHQLRPKTITWPPLPTPSRCLLHPLRGRGAYGVRVCVLQYKIPKLDGQSLRRQLGVLSSFRQALRWRHLLAQLEAGEQTSLAADVKETSLGCCYAVQHVPADGVSQHAIRNCQWRCRTHGEQVMIMCQGGKGRQGAVYAPVVVLR
jgi:hypothetical protein